MFTASVEHEGFFCAQKNVYETCKQIVVFIAAATACLALALVGEHCIQIFGQGLDGWAKHSADVALSRSELASKQAILAANASLAELA